MKKLILMIAVVMMAFAATFAHDRQHTDQTTRDRDTRNRDQATHVRDTRVTNSFQGTHRYRPQHRVHHMRTRHYRHTAEDHQ